MRALVPVVDHLLERFSIPAVCVLADRGMSGQRTIESLEECGWGNVLGVWIRNVKEYREQVPEEKANTAR